MKLTARATKMLFITVMLTSMLLVGYRPPVIAESSLQQEIDSLQAQRAILYEQMDKLRQESAQASEQISEYQQEINVLGRDVTDLQLRIADLQLKIEEIQLQITPLEKSIAEKQEVVDENLAVLDQLEAETFQRLNTGYIEYRTTRKNKLDMLSAKNINSYFKDSQYNVRIQETTNKTINIVADVKSQIEREQTVIEEQKIDLKRNQAVVVENQNEIVALQKQFQQKLESYYTALENQEQRVAGISTELNEAYSEEREAQTRVDKLLEEKYAKMGFVPSGVKVSKGRLIGRQGNTGYSFGAHVHFEVFYNGVSKNPCQYVPSGKFGSCSGNGQLRWPLEGSFYYTSGYGYRSFNGKTTFHRAIDIAHSSWDAPVFAAHDGYVYKGVDGYGGLYVKLCESANCQSGFATVYRHLSSY